MQDPGFRSTELVCMICTQMPLTPLQLGLVCWPANLWSMRYADRCTVHSLSLSLETQAQPRIDSSPLRVQGSSLDMHIILRVEMPWLEFSLASPVLHLVGFWREWLYLVCYQGSCLSRGYCLRVKQGSYHYNHIKPLVNSLA